MAIRLANRAGLHSDRRADRRLGRRQLRPALGDRLGPPRLPPPPLSASLPEDRNCACTSMPDGFIQHRRRARTRYLSAPTTPPPKAPCISNRCLEPAFRWNRNGLWILFERVFLLRNGARSLENALAVAVIKTDDHSGVGNGEHRRHARRPPRAAFGRRDGPPFVRQFFATADVSTALGSGTRW